MLKSIITLNLRCQFTRFGLENWEGERYCFRSFKQKEINWTNENAA